MMNVEDVHGPLDRECLESAWNLPEMKIFRDLQALRDWPKRSLRARTVQLASLEESILILPGHGMSLVLQPSSQTETSKK